MGPAQFDIEKALLGTMAADSTLMLTPAMLVTLTTRSAGLELAPKSMLLGETDNRFEALPVCDDETGLIPPQETRSSKLRQESRRTNACGRDRFLTGLGPGKDIVISLPQGIRTKLTSGSLILPKVTTEREITWVLDPKRRTRVDSYTIHHRGQVGCLLTAGIPEKTLQGLSN